MGSCLQMESQRCCRWSIRFLSCPRLRDEVLLGYFKKTTGPGGLDRRAETVSKGGSRLLWQPTPHNCYSSRQAQKKKRGWEWRTPFLDLMFPPFDSFIMSRMIQLLLCLFTQPLANCAAIHRLYDLMQPDTWRSMFPWTRKHVVLLRSDSVLHFLCLQEGSPVHWCALTAPNHMQCPALACVPHVPWHMHAGRSGLSCAIFVFSHSVCVSVFSVCVCPPRWSGWCTG